MLTGAMPTTGDKTMLRYQYNPKSKKHEVIETLYTKTGNKIYSQVIYQHNDKRRTLKYLFNKTLREYTIH